MHAVRRVVVRKYGIYCSLAGLAGYYVNGRRGEEEGMCIALTLRHCVFDGCKNLSDTFDRCLAWIAGWRSATPGCRSGRVDILPLPTAMEGLVR